VLARIAEVGHQHFEFEIEIAQRLSETESPVARLEPRVEPRGYVRDGFAIALWTYYQPVPPPEVGPDEYASALMRLHDGMRRLEIAAPHFTDRVAEAQSIVASRELSPELPDADRMLLSNTLRSLRQSVVDRQAREQLLHGEPHPGNLIRAKNGLRFIDLETCCRGPVEFDVAHASDAVSEHYPNLDQELLRECRVLKLAMITSWRWDPHDKLPDGRRLAAEWLDEMRSEIERHGLDLTR
jgi:hypothetical protein